MSALALFGAVALAHLLAVMSPGPDFAMVTRQTLAYGRSAGAWTALGIGCGICVHVGWGMFGLGWLIERFPLLLEALRYGGAAFLLWMGSRALRAQPAAAVAGEAPAAAGDGLRHFGIGFATNLLNPKAMLFFVALCSAVITGQTPWPLRVALGLWIVLTTILWFCAVSFTLGHPRIRGALQAHAHWIDRAMGALLVALGLGMLLAGLRD